MKRNRYKILIKSLCEIYIMYDLSSVLLLCWKFCRRINIKTWLFVPKDNPVQMKVRL